MLAPPRSLPRLTAILMYACLVLAVAVACLLLRSCDGDETLYAPAPLTIRLTTPQSVETVYPNTVDSSRYASLVDSLEQLRAQLKRAGITRRIVYDTVVTIMHAGYRYDDSATVHVDDIQRTVSLNIRSSPRIIDAKRIAALFVGADITHNLQRLRPRTVIGYRYPIDDRVELSAQVEAMLEGDVVHALGSVGFRITL